LCLAQTPPAAPKRVREAACADEEAARLNGEDRGAGGVEAALVQVTHHQFDAAGFRQGVPVEADDHVTFDVPEDDVLRGRFVFALDFDDSRSCFSGSVSGGVCAGIGDHDHLIDRVRLIKAGVNEMGDRPLLVVRRDENGRREHGYPCCACANVRTMKPIPPLAEATSVRTIAPIPVCGGWPYIQTSLSGCGGSEKASTRTFDGCG
jgi:hypothetical protein